MSLKGRDKRRRKRQRAAARRLAEHQRFDLGSIPEITVCPWVLANGQSCGKELAPFSLGYCEEHWPEHLQMRDIAFNIEMRSIALTTMQYAEYLETWEWKAKRAQAIALAGGRCRLCNRPQDNVILNVHHRTYDRRGYEDMDDLTVLCQDCHAKFHCKPVWPR